MLVVCILNAEELTDEEDEELDTKYAEFEKLRRRGGVEERGKVGYLETIFPMEY